MALSNLDVKYLSFVFRARTQSTRPDVIHVEWNDSVRDENWTWNELWPGRWCEKKTNTGHIRAPCSIVSIVVDKW